MHVADDGTLKAGRMNSPMSEIKVSIEPVATPGSDNGRVTRRKERAGDAPKSSAASSKPVSNRSRLT